MKKKKVLLIILVCVVVFVGILFGITEFIFGGRIRTIASIKTIQESPNVYEMDYKEKYDLDELLGSNIGSTEELQKYISKKILMGVPISLDGMEFECSAYSAENADGNIVYGRNFDWDANDTIPIIVHTDPKDGYESISTSNISYLNVDLSEDSLLSRCYFLAIAYMPVDGMNEKGFAISALSVPGFVTKQDTGKTPITTSVAIRLLLDRAATADEAIELLKQYDMQSSLDMAFHFLISDSDGNSAVIEFVDNDIKIIESEKSYQICTNFCESETTEDMYDLCCPRYCILNENITNIDGVIKDNESGMNLLKDVSVYDTIWSEYYNQNKLTMDFVAFRDYENIKSYSVCDNLGNGYIIFVEIVIWLVSLGIIAICIIKLRKIKKENIR